MANQTSWTPSGNNLTWIFPAAWTSPHEDPYSPVLLTSNTPHSPTTFRSTIKDNNVKELAGSSLVLSSTNVAFHGCSVTRRILWWSSTDSLSTVSFLKSWKIFVYCPFFSVRQGMNTITRRSDESSVTIPFNRTFRDLDANRPQEGSDALATFNFCGCGWPQHMLIPKGNGEGFPCQLFVMISNYEDDRVCIKIKYVI